MKMEAAHFNYILIALFFATTTALAVGAWKVLNWIWLEPKKLEKLLREQGLRGNKYRLLFGDLKYLKALIQEANSRPIGVGDNVVPRIVPHYVEAIKKFGKNSFMWFGPKPSVLIMDPDSIKEVTLKFNLFEKPHLVPLSDLLVKGLVNYEGDKWAKHRKIINPAFHFDKLKDMLPAFYTSVHEMIGKWEEVASSEGSCELDVWPYLQTLSADAISRTAFGSNYEQGRRIFELQSEQAEHLIKAFQSGYIPGWRFLPTERNRRMKEIFRTVNNLIRSIINARIAKMKAGESFGDDLLGVLLESNAKEIDKHGKKDFGLSINDVIEECKLFYFAGQETTSVLLVWTMVLLSTHPKWQNRAREEVLEMSGTIKPDLDGLNRLKIVNMILYEVLRLYPPLAQLTRLTTEETTLGSLRLPAGVLINLPAILVHHEPAIWGDDASEFNPERFAEGVSNATKGQVTFFPFGWGPRICVGQNFAMLESKMALAMMLQRFSFELSPSYTHAPRSIVTIQPQYGAHLILHRL